MPIRTNHLKCTEPPFYIIRDTFAFNHGLINCYETIEMPLECGVSGVNTATEQQWSISPNPASEFLTISGNTDIPSRITVSSLQQKTVFSGEITGTSLIATHLWPNGIYLVRIDVPNSQTVVQKVCILR